MSSTKARAREAASLLIRWSGIPALLRNTWARKRVTILNYHDPSPTVFERHLEYLSRRYSFIALDALVDAMSNGSWEQLPPKSLVITIDDGMRGNAALLPSIRRYGVRPTIYVCSQIVGTSRRYWWSVAPDPEALKSVSNDERLAILDRQYDYEQTRGYGSRQALSSSEIDRLKDWADFGAHTRFHPILPMCDDEVASAEIALSKQDVERLTGRKCRHFAYPNGSYGDREVDLVRASGYDSARTLDPGWNDPRSDPHRLKMFGVPDDASLNRLAASLAGIAFLRPRAPRYGAP